MQNVSTLYKRHPVVGICARTIEGTVSGNGFTGIENCYVEMITLAKFTNTWQGSVKRVYGTEFRT